MNSRLNNLVGKFERMPVDAFIVTNTANIRYLTRFNAEAAWLLVCPKQAYYLTDGRFTTEARQGLKGIPVLESTHPFLDSIDKLLSKNRIRHLGFDENHMSLATFKKVKKGLPKGVRLIAGNKVIESLREIKDREEIAGIRAALKINLALFYYIKTFLKPGMTERQVLDRMVRFIQAEKVGFSFDAIIASGPNSAFPHAQVTDRRLRAGEPVLIDAGIDLNSYKSDLTRMFFLGKMTTSFTSVRDAVVAAQNQAIKRIRPGILASEIDQEARKSLGSRKLAAFFKHSLGHGVGLEIHEAPWISSKSMVILQAGMVFTVEPGVYLDNKFGVRIEDMVLVTPAGCEVLSR